jgi:hypothetical protein
MWFIDVISRWLRHGQGCRARLPGGQGCRPGKAAGQGMPGKAARVQYAESMVKLDNNAVF